MLYKFIKVLYINENTKSNNEYFGRDNDPVEACFLPYVGESLDEYEAGEMLDSFLWSVCYCDAYTFLSFEVVEGETLETLQDVFYTLEDMRELYEGRDLEYLEGKEALNLCARNTVYRLNCLADTMKLF